jgi:putative flippase GtrA
VSSRQKPLRFILVGILNTGIDFVVLFALTKAGMELIFANMISTSCALAFSFFVNRSFTFGATGNKYIQGAKFMVVTLTALWVLQPIILLLGTALLVPTWGSDLSLLAAKVIATVASMIWNYLFYDRYVFTTRKASS